MSHRTHLLLTLASVVACHAAPRTDSADPVAGTPPLRDVTIFAVDYPEADGGTGRILAVDEEGVTRWSFQLPAAINPYGTYLSDVDYTWEDTVIFTVQGMGIYEIDLDGTLLWSLDDPGATHDVDRLRTGNTLYVRGWATRGEPQVVEVDPEGQVVWSWDGLEAFPDEPYSSLSDEGGGWMHPNGVQRLEDGHTVVCSRNFNTMVVLEPSGAVVESLGFASTGTATSVPSVGPIEGDSPHDCRLVHDEDRVMVALRRPDRAVELDRATREVTWSWLPEEDQDEYRPIRSAARLPEGQRLLVVTQWILLMDRDQTILWRYEAPPVPEGHKNDPGGGPAPDDTAEPQTAPVFPKPLYRAVMIDADGERWGG
jgi:hypothetical protein